MLRTNIIEDKDSNHLKKNIDQIRSKITYHKSNLIKLRELVNNEEHRLNSLKEEYEEKSQELLECQINEAIQQIIPYNAELPSQLIEEYQKENLGAASLEEIQY